MSAPQISLPNGFLSGVNDAPVSNKSENLTPGKYILHIDGLDVIQTRKFEYFLAIRSTVVAVLENPGQALLPGQEASTLFKRQSEYFARNVKNFLVCITGVDQAKTVEIDWETLASQWYTGAREMQNKLVLVNVVVVQGKEDKNKVYHAVNWTKRVLYADLQSIVDLKSLEGVLPADFLSAQIAEEDLEKEIAQLPLRRK